MSHTGAGPLKKFAPRPTGRASADGPDELRLAALDVGSNSVHMIIAQVDGAGGISTLWRAKEMVGLGRASFPSHRLSAVAMDRAALTIGRFAAEARRWQCERVLAVATSAVREADNGGEFIERARAEHGVHVRVVSAREEARLIYLGVRHALDLTKGPHLIVDVGGGSVEFIVADGDKPLLLQSLKLGAARMTAKFVRSDPAEPREVKALLAHYDRELSPVLEDIRRLKPAAMIGSSGAVENLAAMAAALDGGRASANGAGEPGGAPGLTDAGLRRVVDRLLASTSEQRGGMAGLDDKRRDQILAAALLTDEVVRRLGVEQLQVSRSALREGLVVDYLARHRPELEVRREVPNPRRRAVYDLGRRSHWHRAHAEQVALLTVQLFDRLRALHGLGRAERELIEYGALLHDIGAMIGRAGHHKHSAYLINHGGLSPFRPREVRAVACVARYHRKSFPSAAHRDYAALPKRLRRAVDVGAALLRLADGLDRTNCAVVEAVECRTRPDRVELLVSSRGDAELEVWSAQARSDLFEHVFGRPVVVRRKD